MENLIEEVFEGFRKTYDPQQQYNEIQQPYIEDYGNEFLNQLK